jgi:co-chaperonin GroES (HSP10)
MSDVVNLRPPHGKIIVKPIAQEPNEKILPSGIIIPDSANKYLKDEMEIQVLEVCAVASDDTVNKVGDLVVCNGGEMTSFRFQGTNLAVGYTSSVISTLTDKDEYLAYVNELEKRREDLLKDLPKPRGKNQLN